MKMKRSEVLLTFIIPPIAGLLALALIIVSAFAYQWKTDNKDLRKKNLTLRAQVEQSTLDSLIQEANDANERAMRLNTEKEELEAKLKIYEAILKENDLLPEE